MKIIEAIALISINETLIVQLVSFLIFLFLLQRIMIRPLNQTIQNRQDHLTQMSDDIKNNEARYQEIHKEIQQQEAIARETAFKIQSDIETAGKQTATELIAKTRSDINQMRNEAQKEIADKLASASEQIQNEANSIADKMIASLLGGA